MTRGRKAGLGVFAVLLVAAVVSAVVFGLNRLGGDEPASAAPAGSGREATQSPEESPTPTATPIPTPTATPTPATTPVSYTQL
ncbi:halocyanin, partial [Jiangella asiatica]